jgi:four helix bundle protein
MLKKLSFEDLIIWQKAHEMVLKTYQYTARLPKDEAEGLRHELRDAVRAIASYIAEGHESVNPGRKMQFLSYAQESLKKSKYLLLLSEDLSYGKDSELKKLYEEVNQLLIDFMSLTRNNLSLDFVG